MAQPSLFVAMTITDVAPVTAIPTTAAHFALWNGEGPGGKTYSINSLSWTTTTSAAAAFEGQLLAAIIPGLNPIISGTAASGPLSCDGTTGKSKGVVYTAVTLTAGQSNATIWHPVGGPVNSEALTATVGIGQWAAVNGIYRLAPGAILAGAVLCGAAGSAKCKIAVTWSEA